MTRSRRVSRAALDYKRVDAGRHHGSSRSNEQPHDCAGFLSSATVVRGLSIKLEPIALFSSTLTAKSFSVGFSIPEQKIGAMRPSQLSAQRLLKTRDLSPDPL